MRRDLGAATPREPRAPWGAIAWFAFVVAGLTLVSAGSLTFLLVMMDKFQ